MKQLDELRSTSVRTATIRLAVLLIYRVNIATGRQLVPSSNPTETSTAFLVTGNSYCQDAVAGAAAEASHVLRTTEHSQGMLRSEEECPVVTAKSCPGRTSL